MTLLLDLLWLELRLELRFEWLTCVGLLLLLTLNWHVSAVFTRCFGLVEVGHVLIKLLWTLKIVLNFIILLLWSFMLLLNLAILESSDLSKL